jgi:hypothetical protein
LFAFRVPFETARTPVMVILLDNKLVPECATFKSFNIGRASPSKPQDPKILVCHPY